MKVMYRTNAVYQYLLERSFLEIKKMLKLAPVKRLLRFVQVVLAMLCFIVLAILPHAPLT